MKKNIILMGLAMLATTASAQNPMLTTVEVEMNDGQIQNFYSNEGIVFSFLGTKGTVQVPVDPAQPDGETETMETDNVDVFARMYGIGEYSATVFVDCNKEFGTPDGFVISKKINAEPDTVVSAAGLVSNVSDVFREDLTVEIPFDKSAFKNNTLTLNNLAYNTTYYVRPFKMIASATSEENTRLYGEEIKFNTLKTIWAALANEPETAGGCCLLAGDVAVSDEALFAFCKAHADVLGSEILLDSLLTTNTKVGVIEDMARALNESDAAALPVAKTIECVDGTIKLVNTIPAATADKVWNYINSDVMYAPEEFVVNRDSNESRKPEAWASERIQNNDIIVSCTPEEGLPHNSYMLFEPSSSGATPSVSLEIHKSMFARKYRIDVTFAPAETYEDWEGQTIAVPNRLKAEWFNTDEYDRYSSNGLALIADETHMTEDLKYIVAGKLGECDTASFEFIPEQTTGKSIIKLTASVTSAQFNNKMYTRTLRIAEIKVTPIE